MGAKFIRGLATACCFSIAATTAVGGDFPIKHYDLGMEYEALPEFRKSYCRAASDGRNCFESNPPDRIAERPLTSQLLTFYNDERGSPRLESMSFYFHSDHYPDIKLAVTTKFGKLKCSTHEVENRMGAKFKNEICQKAGPSGDMLYIERFTDKITEGSLIIHTKAANVRAAIKAAEDAARKSGDI